MVDRSHLPTPLFEFVVLADTHYVLPEKANTGEFETRLFQTARIGEALRLAAHLDPRFVVHLGDLVQEFPGTASFPEALRQAMAQLEASGLTIHHAAGNHDVGDKPDPTTAAPWTTTEFLDHYHEHVAPSWYSFTEGDLHFMILNTSIMNNEGLDAGERQWKWLESELRHSQGRRKVIGFHIPAFVMAPDEPSLGHYDNIAEPARSRLIDLFNRHDVSEVFAGHSHFAFLNAVGATRYHVVPSTSTTRPGFCELFSSAAPPSQGHNDADKLGVLLVRVYEDDMRIGFLRTHGPVATKVPLDDKQVVLPGVPNDLPASALGVALRHPLTNFADVPITFPSTVRQPVRNDYPLLSLVELGARWIRVPGSDLVDDRLKDRHHILRSHGTSVVGTYLWGPSEDLEANIAAAAGLLDELEIQVPGEAIAGDDVLASVAAIAKSTETPTSLCQVSLGEVRGVQLHRRQRFGYLPGDLPALDSRFSELGLSIDRVVCHVRSRDDLWSVFAILSKGRLQAIDAVDLLIEVGQQDLAGDACLAAEALVALAAMPKSRVFVDTLMQLDRTMDVRGGLLDRTCNPRPAFKVLQTLNTVLFGKVVGGAVAGVERTSYGLRGRSGDGRLLLVLPGAEPDGLSELEAELKGLVDRPATRYELGGGLMAHESSALDAIHTPADPTDPYLILV